MKGLIAKENVVPADQDADDDDGESYIETTRGIRVSVQSFFLEDQSHPDERQFVWAYRVKIENRGAESVKLLRLTWQITDAGGRTQHGTSASTPRALR